MTAPKRIQMTRQRPWRTEHPDAVIVARPSKWGNPFQVKRHQGRNGWWVLKGNYILAETPWREVSTQVAVRLFAERTARHMDLTELAGKDLACWCPLDQPCHADVLLELANARTS